MNETERSAYQRAPRKDKGKLHKVRFTDEYRTYCARRHGQGQLADLSESEVMELIAQGCSTCGDTATQIHRDKPYCDVCDSINRRLGQGGGFNAWLQRVNAHLSKDW